METLQRTANRGSISTGFDIDNSLKLEADNSEYLHYTPSSQTDYERMAFSVWIKRTELGTTQTLAEFGNGTANTTQLRIGFDTDDRLFCYGNSIIWRQTNRVFRDSNAWYHLFFLFDTTQGTSNDRIRIWVNGEMIAHTDFGVINNPGSGTAMGFNKTNQQSLGTQDEDGPKNYFCGYIAQAYGSGGTPPVVGDFGEFDSDSGIWKPIDISGVSIPDANGFFLDFSDSSDLGNDSSSNNNDFTLVNITAADQANDVPTNNFCTFNILVQTDNKPTINEGAMHVAGASNWNNAYGSLGVQNGKWYYEYKVTNTDIGGHGWSTFPDTSDDATSIQFLYDQSAVLQGSGTHYYQRINGTQISNESTGFGTSAVNDIFGVFLNADDQEITFAKNGSVLSGTLSQPISLNAAFSGHFIFPCNVQYEDDCGEFNFGGYTLISNTKSYNDANGYGNFVYSPVLSSVNYYAICTKNIAEFG